MRRATVVILIVLVAAAGGTYLFVRASLASDLVRSTIEQQLSSRLGQPVRIASAGASFFPSITIDLSGVSIGAPTVVQLDAVHIDAGLRGLLSRNISDAAVVVTGGRVTLPLPFPLVASSSPSESPGPAAPITITSVRVISVRDVTLAGRNRTLRIDMESSLDGDRLDVMELTARAEHSQIRASGAVESLARLEGKFDATADPLDLDELIAIGSAFSNTSAAGENGGAPVPMHVVVKLSAPAGQFASFPFRDLATTLDVTPTHVGLSPLAVRSFGGSFKGRLDADTRGETPQLRLVGELAHVDVVELMRASESPGGITGSLSGTLSLTGQGWDTQTLLGTARGTIAASIANGSLPHLEMVRAIVLAFGKPSGVPPKGSGSAFSRLGGTFGVADGVLTSKDVTMMSRDFDMHGTGSLRIMTGALHARMNVVLSTELTAQAGTDLRRYAQEDGRVIVPASIDGTLQQPTISIDLVAAARRAIGSELRRRATSFIEGLLKKKKE